MNQIEWMQLFEEDMQHEFVTEVIRKIENSQPKPGLLKALSATTSPTRSSMPIQNKLTQNTADQEQAEKIKI